MAINPATFFQRPVYEVLLSPEEIVRDLEALRVLDGEAEAEVAAACGAAWKWVLLLAVGVFTIPFFVGIPLVIIAVWRLYKCNRRHTAASARDVDNRRYETLLLTLKRLTPDLPAREPLRVRLDLTPFSSDAKQTGTSKIGVWDVRHFRDAWLSLEGTLLDGTQFRFLLTEISQIRHKSYRSRSGKWKSKSKTKTTTLCLLDLRTKLKRYGDLSAFAEQAPGAVKLPEGALVKRLHLEGRRLSLRTATKVAWEGKWAVNWIALQFLSAYQILNLARHVARKAG